MRKIIEKKAIIFLIILILLLPISFALISLDKEAYELGETVNMNFSEAFEELRILEGESVYRFLGESETEMSFIPQAVGNYTIEIVLLSGLIETKYFEVVETNSEQVVLPSNQSSLNENFMRIENSKGDVKNHVLKIIDQTSGKATAQLDFNYSENLAVTKIKFKKLNVQGAVNPFKIENVPVQKLNHKKFIDAFAIDPTNVDFEEAEVTFTAVGTELWKCKDYNFATQTCYGKFVKIANLVPGEEYTFILTPEDPIFSQTGYLVNPNFESNITAGWTAVNETSPSVNFSWIASDSGQNGVAEISNNKTSANSAGHFYQEFNLTIPLGTILDNINFSALWRISIYDQPGNISLLVQNQAQSTTYCSYNQSFSSTTVWAKAEVKTSDAGCSISDFSADTIYTFKMRCNLVTGAVVQNETCLWDEAAVIVNYNDTQNPVINLFDETPDPVDRGDVINITVNVTDNIDVSSVWLELEGTNYSATRIGLTDNWYYDSFDTDITSGLYYYKIFANDTTNNSALSQQGNFTIIESDLGINSENISFSNNNPVEGEQITIYANITNNADKNETNVTVQFWDGDPDLTGVQINNNQSINFSALETVTVNTVWGITLGKHDIFVVVDPPFGSGNITEINETNNKANNTISVGSWQKFYGVVNNTFSLGNSNNISFNTWFSATTTGNIYVADTDTTAGISWTSIKALTRNQTGETNANTLNDFEDADINLGMTDYFDSVNETYSEGGNPKTTDSFTVFGSLISNVPIVNSTNTSNFITGILWDSDDSLNAYYDVADDEDLVFVTKVNENKVGAYGVYDYEIRIPSNLKAYKGASETVNLYYELV